MLKQLQKEWTAEATCQNNAAWEGGVQHAMEFTLLMTCLRLGTKRCSEAMQMYIITSIPIIVYNYIIITYSKYSTCKIHVNTWLHYMSHLSKCASEPASFLGFLDKAWTPRIGKLRNIFKQIPTVSVLYSMVVQCCTYECLTTPICNPYCQNPCKPQTPPWALQASLGLLGKEFLETMHQSQRNTTLKVLLHIGCI